MPELAKIHNPRATKKLTNVRKAKERQQRRLYATSHPVWRRLRAEQLRKEPLCRACSKTGRIVAGNTVDHINGDTYNNTPENLQTLCKSCHDHKTGIETGFGSTTEGTRRIHEGQNSVLPVYGFRDRSKADIRGNQE